MTKLEVRIPNEARMTRNGHVEPQINTDNRADVSDKTIGVHPGPSVVSRAGHSDFNRHSGFGLRVWRVP
jgi:hypothetical protein